jgi:hypothetical protein
MPYPDRPDVLPKSQRQSFGLRSGYGEIGFQDALEWFCNILKEIQNRDKSNDFLKTRKPEEPLSKVEHRVAYLIKQAAQQLASHPSETVLPTWWLYSGLLVL